MVYSYPKNNPSGDKETGIFHKNKKQNQTIGSPGYLHMMAKWKDVFALVEVELY